jgi:muramoyltetrapeptide carboxypeptidase
MGSQLRIGVVAPGTRIDRELAERVKAFASDSFLDRAPEIVFHPQCFLSAGHFAGDDSARADAFVEFANDPSLNAIWFAKGGYGACRMAEAAISRLNEHARAKTYLGYSDAGALLGGLYARGFKHVAHGPMPVDMARAGGEGAVRRALAWLIERAPESVELGVMFDGKTAAFNIMVLQSILNTPLEPDLAGHVLMLEDVSEYLYRLDRALFAITSSANIRRAKGIKLGRLSDVPENDKPFGASDVEMIQYWCKRAGVAYLGRADIGHDVENKIVPFGASG